MKNLIAQYVFVVAEFMAFQRTNAKVQRKTKHKNELLRDVVCLFGSFFSKNGFLNDFSWLI
jgi:hypothetical protein